MDKKKLIGILLSVAMVAAVLPNIAKAGDPQDASTPQLPSFSPSIADKKLDPNFYKPFVPSTPLAESEITTIVFDRDWILKNDFDSDPGTVRITFPAGWLNDLSHLESNDTVKLRVPARLLRDHDESNIEGEMNVSFPNRYFDSLPSPAVSKPALVSGSSYSVWWRRVDRRH